MASELPPLPPGFKLDASGPVAASPSLPSPESVAQSHGATLPVPRASPSLPPLPPGFTLDSSSAASQPPGLAAEIGSAIARPVAKGVAALPLMAMDAGVAARNLIGDAANKAMGKPTTPDYELPSAMFNRALDAYTVKPTGIGKAAEFVSSSLVGGKLGTPETEAAASTLKPEAQAARDAGYVLPPSQARPTALNQIAEGISGKIKTQQLASIKNQGTTNALVRKALGLKADTPITVGILNAVRQKAGQAYNQVRQVGAIATDKNYRDTLDAIGAKYASAAKEFGRQADHPVKTLVDRLSKVSTFTGDGAINEIGLLREEAEKAAAQRDKGLATALRQAAGAIEDQIDRHLVQSKQPIPMIRNFRQAREIIAKSYSVQQALDRATGDVSAQKLAAQFARDKPLSGELKTVARFGTSYPKAAQLPSKIGSVTHFSPLDMAVMGMEGASGLSAAIASGNPKAAAAAATAMAMQAARPAIRSAILSPGGQTLAAEGMPAAASAAKRLTLALMPQSELASQSPDEN